MKTGGDVVIKMFLYKQKNLVSSRQFEKGKQNISANISGGIHACKINSHFISTV